MNEIFNRASVRVFKDAPVEKEKIEMLLKAAMQAPSAGNQRPWEFIVVEDKKTLEQLSETPMKCVSRNTGNRIWALPAKTFCWRL